jgi:peptide/nickel transport system ATP-binding protein
MRTRVDPILRVRNIGVGYRVSGHDLPALQDVSFEIRPREIVGLVGESGSGKSTVASAIIGILARNGRVTDGSIEFAGRDLTLLKPEEMRLVRGAEIAMVFQDPLGSLNPTMRVGHQLLRVAASHPEKSLKSVAARRARIIELFGEVGIPDPDRRFDDYPHQFSGGMRQRIVIAMALMLEPRLIIADEATSALDVTLQAQILELFREVRERHGTSLLLISHDLGVVAQTCDRVSVMYAGKIVETADTSRLFRDPKHPYTKALLAAAPSYEDRDTTTRGIAGRVPGLHELPAGCAFAARCVDRHLACETAMPPLHRFDNHDVRCHLYDPTGSAVPVRSADPPPVVSQSVRPITDDADRRSPLVVVRGLVKDFGEHRSIADRMRHRSAHAVHAVSAVDLDLFPGEILGLVGESGSGKTTLAMTLMRLVEPTSGDIRFDGNDVSAMARGDLRRLRARMQLILQDAPASLSPKMRVRNLLTEPYKITRTPIDQRSSPEDLLGLVGLSPDLADKFPYQLSGGQARRVSIARALSLRPDLIVADEPTSGLDVSAAAGVLGLMNDLREQLGITYLIITHDLNLVGQVADRIMVMYLGQVVEAGTTQQIFEDPVHPYTQGLLAAVPRIQALDVELAAVPRGEMPSPRTPPPGCRFHTRCRMATERCAEATPVQVHFEPEHFGSCHFWEEARATRPPLVAAKP